MRKLVAAVAVAASLLVTGGSVALAAQDPYTPQFRLCVAEEYSAWRADVEAFMIENPGYDEAGEIARNGYPRNYEEALVHPEIGTVCGPEGSRR